MINTSLFANYNASPVNQYLACQDISEEKLGVVLKPNLASGPEFCYHDIFKKDKPPEVNGVIYPPNFKSLQKLTPEELGKAQQHLIEWYTEIESDSGKPSDVDFINLFTPALFPQKGITELQLITAQICKLRDGVVNNEYIEPFITDSPETPIAYLPSEFSSELQDLKFTDVLTIFPPNEAKLLAICIGRALVGSDGMTHVHTKTNVNHAFRTFCLIYGFSAGTGKSTLFDFLWDAIESTGYTVSHFNSLDNHFGLGEICSANVAYADDLLTKTLSSLLQAPLFKQMITGAKIRAHVKYAPDVEVKSQATFFACVNDFSPNALYGLDNGTLNRLAILSTYTDFEIHQLKGFGVSEGSPNLRTREHVEWLQNKLGVDRKAIMLKFASECAKMFLGLMENGTLESEVNKLKRGLRTQIHEALEFSTIQLMMFCYILREGKKPGALSNGEMLKTTFRHLDFIINDDRANSVRNAIKKSWCDAGRPSQHIWSAMKLLDNVSVNNCHNLDTGPSILKDSVKSIKAYWQDLRLASGFNLAGNVAHIKQNWEVARSGIHQINSLLDECKALAHVDVLVAEVKAKTDHLERMDYDREEYIKELNG